MQLKEFLQISQPEILDLESNSINENISCFGYKNHINMNNFHSETYNLHYDEGKAYNQDWNKIHQEDELLKVFDEPRNIFDNNDYNEEKEDKSIINKVLKEYIQRQVKGQIYLKKPFKEKKKLGRKIKAEENLGEHNKFSDDNIQRKLKNAIINSLLEFINNKIISFHQGTKKNLRLIGKLKQNTSESSKVQYSKDLLNRTLGSIFSQQISSKYSRHSHYYNRDLVESLLNSKAENERDYFKGLFNLTFTDALNHFRGTVLNEKLMGLKTFEQYCAEIKSENYGEDYKKVMAFCLMNYENDIMSKKSRVKKK